MRKRILIRILVLAGALAVWDLVLKAVYYDWATTQEPLASSAFGTAMLGYGMVLCAAYIAAWFLTREKEEARA